MFGFGVRPEMDALGKRRSNRITFNNDEVEQTLNQLLASMDGLVANKGMVVLAATNRCARSAPCLSRRSQAARVVSLVARKRSAPSLVARKRSVPSLVALKRSERRAATARDSERRLASDWPRRDRSYRRTNPVATCSNALIEETTLEPSAVVTPPLDRRASSLRRASTHSRPRAPGPPSFFVSCLLLSFFSFLWSSSSSSFLAGTRSSTRRSCGRGASTASCASSCRTRAAGATSSRCTCGGSSSSTSRAARPTRAASRSRCAVDGEGGGTRAAHYYSIRNGVWVTARS